jgi:hypothetical protein
MAAQQLQTTSIQQMVVQIGDREITGLQLHHRLSSTPLQHFLL